MKEEKDVVTQQYSFSNAFVLRLKKKFSGIIKIQRLPQAVSYENKV